MAEYASIKEDVLKKLEENLSGIRERFGIETIGVFGSVSRGTDTALSDVDVMISCNCSPSVEERKILSVPESGKDVSLVSWVKR